MTTPPDPGGGGHILSRWQLIISELVSAGVCLFVPLSLGSQSTVLYTTYIRKVK